MNKPNDVTDKMTDIVMEALAGFPAEEREKRLKAFVEGAEALSSPSSAPQSGPRGTSSNSSQEPHASPNPVLARGFGR